MLQYSSTDTTVIQIANIYQILHETDCGAVTCKLQNPNTLCDAADALSATIASNSEITVAPTTNAITIKRDYAPGFTHTVCIRCESADANSLQYIKTFNTWKIQVVMDCTTSVATLAQGATGVPSNDIILPYTTSATPYDYVDSWLKLFSEVDGTNCPVTSCLLMNTDCTTTPAVNTNFYMLLVGAIANPWALSAK